MSATKISACPVLLTRLPGVTPTSRFARIAGQIATMRQYWWVLPLLGIGLLLFFGGQLVPRRHAPSAPEPEIIADVGEDCGEDSGTAETADKGPQSSIPETAQPELILPKEDNAVEPVVHVEKIDLQAVPTFEIHDESVQEPHPAAGATISAMPMPSFTVRAAHGNTEPPQAAPALFPSELPVQVVTGPSPTQASHGDESSLMREIACLKGHDDIVTCAAFVPGQRWILSGSHDQSLVLWDLNTNKEVRKFGGHQSEVNCLAVSRDGKQALSGAGCYEYRQNKATPVDCIIRMWDLETGTELKRFIGHTGPVTAVAFSPDGGYLLSASHDHTVRLWEISTGRALRSLTGHTSAVHGVAFSPDGRLAFSAGGSDRTVRVWDLRTGHEMQSLHGNTGPVKCVVALADGHHILSAGGDLIHGDRGALQSFDCDIHLWDLRTGKIVHNFQGHPLPVLGLALSPDGKRLLSGGLDGTLCLWDLVRGQEITQIDAHANWLWSVAFSSDGSLGLTTSSDRTIKTWKLP